MILKEINLLKILANKQPINYKINPNAKNIKPDLTEIPRSQFDKWYKKKEYQRPISNKDNYNSKERHLINTQKYEIVSNWTSKDSPAKGMKQSKSTRVIEPKKHCEKASPSK